MTNPAAPSSAPAAAPQRDEFAEFTRLLKVLRGKGILEHRELAEILDEHETVVHSETRQERDEKTGKSKSVVYETTAADDTPKSRAHLESVLG